MHGAGPVTDRHIEQAAVAVRAFLAGRPLDRAAREDVAQEAVTRLIEARDRLDGAAAIPYAVTIAKNLVIGAARRVDVAARHAHLVAAPALASTTPEDLTLHREEAEAVEQALAGLPTEDREVLVAHVVNGQPTAELAASWGGTAGGVAARLARARARMRLDYLLAARDVRLPSANCRQVLLALSAGDRRRQHALGTAHHLLTCDVCDDLAPPLVERERRLVGLVPIPVLAPLLGRLRRLSPRQALASAAGAAVAASAVVAAVLVLSDDDGRSPRAVGTTAPASTTTTRPSSTTIPAEPAPSLVVGGLDGLALAEAGGLADRAGRRAEAAGVVVTSVPADEGFWVGGGPGRRVWVQLQSTGESRIQVRTGMRLRFDGIVVHHDAAYAEALGLPPAEVAELTAQGAHVEVDPATLAVVR